LIDNFKFYKSEQTEVSFFDFLSSSEEVYIFWLIIPFSTYFGSDSCERNLHALHHEVLFEGRVLFELIFTTLFGGEPVTCIFYRGVSLC
jgi:hypothetical protein